MTDRITRTEYFASLKNLTSPSGRSVREIAEAAAEKGRIKAEPVIVRPASQASCSYTIAIDPGVETGFALVERATNKLLELTTTDFWGAMERVRSFGTHEVKVIVELLADVPTFRERKGKAGSGNVLDRMARNVGAVTMEAQLIVSGLRGLGYDVSTVRPTGKVKADDFKMRTGWTERTNQHERDAALIALRA